MKKSVLLLFSILLTTSVAWGRQNITQPPLNIKTLDGTTSNYPYQFIVPNGTLTDGANGTMTFSISTETVNTIVVTTITPTNIVGTNTNNNATAGSYGEWIQAYASGVSAAATGVFANITSVSLSTGDWDVSGMGMFSDVAGTTSGPNNLAISAFSGNTQTDHVASDNQSYGPTGGATLSYSLGFTSIAAFRMSLASTTTVYLKGLVTYASGSPALAGRISARRVR